MGHIHVVLMSFTGSVLLEQIVYVAPTEMAQELSIYIYMHVPADDALVISYTYTYIIKVILGRK